MSDRPKLNADITSIARDNQNAILTVVADAPAGDAHAHPSHLLHMDVEAHDGYPEHRHTPSGRTIWPRQVLGVYVTRDKIEQMAGGPLPVPERLAGGLRCKLLGLRHSWRRESPLDRAVEHLGLEVYLDTLPRPGDLITVNGGVTYVVEGCSWHIQERGQETMHGDVDGPGDLEVVHILVHPRDIPPVVPDLMELARTLIDTVENHGGHCASCDGHSCEPVTDDGAALVTRVMGLLEPLYRENQPDMDDQKRAKDAVRAAQGRLDVAMRELRAAQTLAGL